MKARDLAGRRFGNLIAQYPTGQRDKKGAIIWHCDCDCGGSVDVVEYSLLSGNTSSCGCRKCEAMREARSRETFVDGTWIEFWENQKERKNNTSGFRGVRQADSGRWRASITFKKHTYHLGMFDTFHEAADARIVAEALLPGEYLTKYYARLSVSDG